MGESAYTTDDKRVMYLKCALCTQCIGPGFLMDEVWYVPHRQKYACRLCGELYEDRGARKIVTTKELLETGGGITLLNLLKERKREL